MAYKIVSDSTANILTLDGVEFQSVPLKIRVEDIEYTDDANVDVDEMIAHLKRIKTKSTTACPSPDEYLEAFGDADRIFCTTISGNLSGSFNSARLAKEEFEEKYPDKKVFVIDSLAAGPGVGILVEKLEELISAGTEYDEICSIITEYNNNTGIYFSLESLRNFANNGRVNPAIAKITGMLGIRLVGNAGNNGTLTPTDKCRGEAKAIDTVYKNMLADGYKGGKVIVSHTHNENAVHILEEKIKSDFPDANVKITKNRALCSFYAEPGGFLVSYERL